MTGTLLDLVEPRKFLEDRKDAFVFWDGAWPYCHLGKLSYRALRKKAENLARALPEIGVKQGDRLAVMLPNMLQFPVVYFGALMAGVVAVPINPLYARTPEEIAKILNDSGAESIVALDLFLPALEEIEKNVRLKNIIVATAVDSLPILKKIAYYVKTLFTGNYFYYPSGKNPKIKSYAQMIYEGGQPRNIKIKPQDLALILYTSGTTGDPKGVMHTHESLLANAYACKKLVLELGLEESKEIFLAAVPYFHIMGIVAMLNTALLMRAKIVLIPKPSECKTMLEAICHTRATGFVGTPGFFKGLAGELKKDEKKEQASSLKLCISGASKMDLKTKQEFESLWGGKILIGYGLSETGVTHCQREGGETDSIGFPLDGVEEKIIDTDENFIGELCIRSKSNMVGYWHRPEKAREVLCSEGWLMTGDLAKKDTRSGVVILGRAESDFVKGKGGEKISLSQVEDVLMQHSQVVDAAAVGSFFANKRGYEIKAFVALRDPKTSCGEYLLGELMKLCKDNLSLAERPDEIKCVKIIPRNAMGKVLKKQLKASG